MNLPRSLVLPLRQQRRRILATGEASFGTRRAGGAGATTRRLLGGGTDARLQQARCSGGGSSSGDAASGGSNNNSGTIIENPLAVVKDATEALRKAQSQLESIAEEIQKPITLPSDQVVTLKDIVLHSRDAEPADFDAKAARSARSTVLPVAELIESYLKDFSADYEGIVVPQMEKANGICQQLGCGGASLEVDESDGGAAAEQVSVKGKDTPCGKMHQASFAFLQATYDTREPILLGSRCALIVRLANELNMPLSSARKEDDLRQKLGQVFASDVVPTPWIRSSEEYEQLFQIQKDLEADLETEFFNRNA